MCRWEAGTWWDDAACYTRETFVCEDSTDLLTRWAGTLSWADECQSNYVT